jgi:hypothetical protein
MRPKDVRFEVLSALWALALIWVLLLGSAAAIAQDIGGVIALPDAPFVIPTPDRAYTFPDHRSDDILTQRNDNNRSGVSHIRGLNQETARRMRKVAEWQVGHVVVAQPLYISAGRNGPKVIIATSNNDVFAFSPSQTNPTGWLWRTSLGPPLIIPVKDCDPTVPPFCVPQVDHPAPRFEVRCMPRDTAFWEEPGGEGRVGIESTPVIDAANNQVVVAFRSKDGNSLAAIDLDDGHVKRSIVVPAPAPGWHAIHRNRASLLLANGVIYVAYASLCEGDTHLFHGSVFAFDARALDEVGYFQVTDDATDGGGIWQASTGIAADTIGNLYFATGNRRKLDGQAPTFDQPNYSNSIIRLKVEKIWVDNPASHPGETYKLTMQVADYFSPYRKIWQDLNDMDLGSGGVTLIPGTRYLMAGGKEGIIYVLDRANMGRWDDIDDAWHLEKTNAKLSKLQSEEPDDPHRDNVQQKFLAAQNRYQNDPNSSFRDGNQLRMNYWQAWPHIHGTPVFARFGAQSFMFVWPEKDKPKRFRWRDEAFDPSPLEADILAPPLPLPENKFPDGSLNYLGNGMPGGMLSVNVDPTQTNSGVVLGSVPECRKDANHRDFECIDQRYGALHVFDPMTMEEIWNNRGMNGLAKDDYWFAKFVPPTIAVGRVFLATASGKVIVYSP